MLSLPKVATKTEIVLDALRDAILSGTFPPGYHLKQEEIAARMGVSQAPVREAFQRLAREGLVTIIRHRGVVVSSFEPEVVLQVYRIRATLEGLAAEMVVEHLSVSATAELAHRLEKLNDQMMIALRRSQIGRLPKIDKAFHQSIFDICPSVRLVRMITEMREERLQDHTFWIPGRSKQSISEHALIISAIADRNPAAARDAARSHVENVGRAVRKSLGRTAASDPDAIESIASG